MIPSGALPNPIPRGGLPQARPEAGPCLPLSEAERLASFLLELSERQGRCGGRRNPVWVPMAATDIADHLGLRIETVSRRMSAFAKGGLIRRADAHRVELLDRARLTEIAEGGEEE